MLANKINSASPSAVVIGLDSITGLQTARILRAHNIPVIGVAKDLGHYCCKTNACERIVEADTDSDDLIHVLENLGAMLAEKAVLYPCSDISVLHLSRERHRLQEWYSIILPAAEVIEMMIDKVKFYRYAQENGFPIPKTYFISSREEAEAAAVSLTFPVILKPPYRPIEWRQQTHEKAFKVANTEELLSHYAKLGKLVDILIAQEWIDGNDTNHITSNCYFNNDSQPLVTFTTRKLRQWPQRTGQGCFGEAYRDDHVACETIRLYQSVGFQGLGYLEMKQDEKSGKYFIIEPNAGRPTGRSATAEANGVDLIYTMYCDAVGWPLPASREQKEGLVKWIYFRRDVQSAFFSWRHHELSLREWWQSIRGPKWDAVFSWHDPAPFWFDLLKAVGLLIRRRSAS
jgi:predicted ATP-grasp superfamily ATP-dependent carboligase